MSGSRPRRLPRRSLLACTALVIGLLGACGPTEAELPDSRSGNKDGIAEQEAAVERLLPDLEAAFAGREPAPPALEQIVKTAQTFKVRDLRLRYVAPADSVQNSGVGPQPADEAVTFVAELNVEWRQSGGSAIALGAAQLTLASDGTPVALSPSASGRIPTWLVEGLAAQRRGRLVVQAPPGPALAELTAMGRRALAANVAFLPQWRGDLVLVLAPDQSSMERIVGSTPGEAGQIAAITTTIDGNLDREAATHVVINPAAFGDLSRAGKQLVVTHEATHVAVKAPTSPVPTWLLEGFADYVALRDGAVPVQRAAQQILAEVAAGQVPSELPVNSDFGARTGGLGARYESAWLAARTIADSFGEDALNEVYFAVDQGTALDRAFADILATSVPEFTARWRAALVDLADDPRD